APSTLRCTSVRVICASIVLQARSPRREPRERERAEVVATCPHSGEIGYRLAQQRTELEGVPGACPCHDDVWRLGQRVDDETLVGRDRVEAARRRDYFAAQPRQQPSRAL